MKENWMNNARKEKRLCKECQEPMSKDDWLNPRMQGLCHYCKTQKDRLLEQKYQDELKIKARFENNRC